MLNALRNLSERMGLSQTESLFDPAVFNDPVALGTSWKSLKSGGANFCTGKLVEVNPDRMEVKPTVGVILFCLIFMGVGIASITAFGKASAASGFDFLFPAGIGTLFVGVGGGMLWKYTVPVVFDSRREYFWKGRKSPANVVNRRNLKCFAEYEEIHALQLISEFCSGNKSSYYSYELNLVLKDGRRINVIDHGMLKKVREDAERLADFLRCPLWDAIHR